MPDHEAMSTRPALSRRGLLTAAGALGAGGLLAGCGAPSNAMASNPPVEPALDLESGLQVNDNFSAVRERALSQVGKRRGGSDWEQLSPNGEWNFAFLTWLLRPGASSVPGSIDNLRVQAKRAGALSSKPREGAVIIRTSPQTGEGINVEIVTDITDLAIFTVAGDIARPIPPEESFVRRFCYPPDASLVYYYPTYSS